MHTSDCSVALSGLGVPSSVVAACRQFVLYVPGEAESALQRLGPILEGKLADAAGSLSSSLNHLQVLWPSHSTPALYYGTCRDSEITMRGLSPDQIFLRLPGLTKLDIAGHVEQSCLMEFQCRLVCKGQNIHHFSARYCLHLVRRCQVLCLPHSDSACL